MDEAYEMISVKHHELVTRYNEKGWAVCFPIKIGCRGFAGRSARKTMSSLGLNRRENPKFLYEVGDKAKRASKWILIKRDVPNWNS